ncbi:MAG: nucleotidyltransferase domain-containing protein [Ignisphaera sp.]
MKILLTGSIAEGKFVKGLSDIDVMVVVRDVDVVKDRFAIHRVKDVDVEITIVSEKELKEAIRSGNQFYIRALKKVLQYLMQIKRRKFVINTSHKL